MKKIFVVACLLGAFSSEAARSVLGIKFEDTIEVEGKNLTLNGVGIRDKEIALGFKVHVYVAALYVEKASQDGKALIASPETKLLRMVYARGVDKQKLRETWQENFDKHCATCEKLKPTLETFKTFLEDMDADQVQEYAFVGSKVKVTSKKKLKGEVDSAEFQKFLLSIWLDHAPNPELKSGLLGLTKE